jgi:hypothetical protein
VPTVVEIVSGPFFAACGVLVVTGVAKLRQPGATTAALHGAFGVEVPAAAGRALGAVEVAIAIVAALAGGWTAFAVAALYASFFAVALVMRRRVPGAGCGCIGERSAAIGTAHLVTSAAATAIAIVYATAGDGLVTVLRDQPVAGLPYLALAACAVGCTTLFLTMPSEERSWRH